MCPNHTIIDAPKLSIETATAIKLGQAIQYQPIPKAFFLPTPKSIVDGFPLWTTNYVILESTALLQNRIGMEAVQNFHRNLVPLLHVKWIDPQLHADALAIYLATNQRRLSLVDCSSFTAMRLLKIDTVFAFDGHFSEQGFRTIPAWEQTGQ